MLHYDPQYVSSSTLLILRRTNCITTASGIVTLSKQLCSMPVESGLMHSSFILQQYVCYTTIFNMFRAACCSKHVEDRSVTYILLKNKEIVH